MTARQRAQALVTEGLEETFNDAVGALLDMGDISEGQAERLYEDTGGAFIDSDLEAAAQDAYDAHSVDAEEVASEAAFFDRIGRSSEIRGLA